LRDRLRNKLYRWLGLVPRDDFIQVNNDVFNVLESFERFTKASNMFCNIVAERLGIKFDGKKVVEDNVKSEEAIEDEYRSRGMI